MSGIEKIKKYIERTSKRCESRVMSLEDAEDLARNVEHNPIGTIILAFCYGRAKGYRAAKAEAMKVVKV
ncbi:MAG: hypothetical protein HDT14_13055 [Oscillibacter sp.]|nr:hypothetical protein [Oscillibacter sp.]